MAFSHEVVIARGIVNICWCGLYTIDVSSESSQYPRFPLANVRGSLGPLELQVADTGCGLSDVTKSLVLFSSTKSKSEQGGGRSLITPGCFRLKLYVQEDS